MAQNENPSILKVALLLFALVTIVYGLGLVFFTVDLIEMSGSEPFEPNWLRWAGGTLFALGIAAILAFRNPAKQDIYVIAIGLGTLFTGLALLYQLLFDWNPENDLAFTVVPCILNLVMSTLLWWGRNQAKDILRQD